MLKRTVFDNFNDYWYYAKYLSKEQRKIIFKCLSVEEKQSLENSYLKDGWCDLFYRNEINEKIDSLKEKYDYDIFNIRFKAIKGKSVYVPSAYWDDLLNQLKDYKPEVTAFVFSGLEAMKCDANPDVTLIVYEKD